MIADSTLTGAKIADNSISGGDVDESTLQGVNAAKLGGLEVKKINFQVPSGTGVQSVVVFPGIFRIDAQCQNFGDFLDISAATGVDNAAISETAINTGFEASDTNGAQRDIVSRRDGDFDTNEVFEVDNRSELISSGSDLTLHFSTPDGFVAVTELSADAPGAGCRLTGMSTGG